jgi:beta-lactamase regulating signal transducer with metallopeptidase domain
VIAALLDHLWQSTLFAAAIAMLALLVRRQAARLRFALWLAASLKFLIPFSALVSLGRWLLPPLLVPAQVLATFEPAALPFSAGPISIQAAPTLMTGELLLALWTGGMVFALARASWHLYELHLLVRDAIDLDIAAPVPVKSAASFLEPGLIGIFKPVILLPQGLAHNLTHEELDAVLAHELSHLARRDNLTAALHMLVEAIFWFHPLVWWISRRLVEERERACDENVLACGNPPLVYAQSILKVCRYYVQTPLACASGMSGPDLNIRLTAIMQGGAGDELPPATGLLLAAAGAATLMLPIAAGMLGSLPVTPIAARMERALNMALPLSRAIPTIVAPVPHPTAHRHPIVHTAKAAATPIASASVESAPRPVAAQGAVIVSVIDPTLPALPPTETQADETICRRPQALPGSRLPGPAICKLQSEWAALKTQGLDVAPDGSVFKLGDYEKTRSLATPPFCTMSNPGGSPGTSNVFTYNPGCR